MAQTAKGQKFNRVPSYKRKGKTVKGHARSNPTTSKAGRSKSAGR